MKDVEINRLKDKSECAKIRLIEISSELEEIGAIREYKSLCTIIGRLEAWQNK